MIGALEKPVIDVPDLEAGARFWGALTGFAPRPAADPKGRFLGLGTHEVDGSPSVRLLLQKVDHPVSAGGVHLDFKVRDLSAAIAAVQAIGGTIKRPPSVYPDDGAPYLEWAVMQDPWGTPFCLIRHID